MVKIPNIDDLSYVIIPIRGIHFSMSRLRINVSSERVDKVVSKLFFSTIKILLDKGLFPVVITPDLDLKEQLDKKNITCVIDEGISLNYALKEALTKDLINQRILFLMPDLPGLDSDCLNKIIHCSKLFTHGICPTIDGGTSAMFTTGKILQLGYFGKNSYSKFLDYFRTQTIPIAQLRIRLIERDLDTIDDYDYWMENSPIINDRMLSLNEG